MGEGRTGERRRRRAGVAAVVWPVLALSGCGGGSAVPAAAPPPSPPPPTEPGPEPELVERCDAPAAPRSKIVVWHPFFDNPVYRQPFDDVIAGYRAAHPDIVVETVAKDSMTMLVDLESGYGEVPDLVLGRETDLVRLADSGRTMPAEACLPDTSSLDDLAPAIRATWSRAGRLWAVPYGASTPVLWYNGPLLRDAGIAPPRTRDELGTALRVLRDRLGHPAMRYDFELVYVLAEQWSARRGRPLVERDAAGRPRLHLDRPDIAEDLRWLRDLDREQLIRATGDVDTVEDLAALIDPVGTTALAVQTSSSTGFGRQLLDSGVVSPDQGMLAPLPGPEADSPPNALAGGLGIYFVKDTRTDPRAAAGLVSFLAQPDQQAHVAALTGYVAPGRSAETRPELADALARYPQMRVGRDALYDPGNRGEPLLLGVHADLRQFLIEAYRRMLSGEDPAAVLAEAQRGATEALDAYERVHHR